MTTPNKLNNLSGFLKEIYEAGKINKVLNYDLSNEFKSHGNKCKKIWFIFLEKKSVVQSTQMR